MSAPTPARTGGSRPEFGDDQAASCPGWCRLARGHGVVDRRTGATHRVHRSTPLTLSSGAVALQQHDVVLGDGTLVAPQPVIVEVDDHGLDGAQ